MADDVARYFNQITANYPPLTKRATVQESVFEPLELYQVSARIKSFKKPRSMIRGDIFPDLVTKFCDIVAIPMTDIINQSLADKTWPEEWKNETMIIIPKVSHQLLRTKKS